MDLSANFVMAMQTSFARDKAKSNTRFTEMKVAKVIFQRLKYQVFYFKTEVKICAGTADLPSSGMKLGAAASHGAQVPASQTSQSQKGELTNLSRLQ